MSNETKPGANYDPHLIDAETAARMEREKDNFKKTPDEEGGIDTTGGYTVDKEGLLNNYAIEPEMYVNEPGDLREKEEQLAAEEAEKRQEINKTGGQGQGTGII